MDITNNVDNNETIADEVYMVEDMVHPIDPTVTWPNDNMLFISDFPHQNENCGYELKELLNSWNCGAFYDTFMSIDIPYILLNFRFDFIMFIRFHYRIIYLDTSFRIELGWCHLFAFRIYFINNVSVFLRPY